MRGSPVILPPGEPTVRSVDAAAAAASTFGPDVLVGVGGGSVLDTVKALSALVRSPVRLSGFWRAFPVPSLFLGRGLPWIAIPTTAGTGAEVTKNAVIKSETARRQEEHALPPPAGLRGDRRPGDHAVPSCRGDRHVWPGCVHPARRGLRQPVDEPVRAFARRGSLPADVGCPGRALARAGGHRPARRRPAMARW